ncbi:unnamed protein product [Euphydryas editha]|uniref:FP protein C-terminal domain-containing protein n=1 Tax=Euphydryas editha TaxID=104508 RepID=A0AAU9TEN4_EUPED|nr:unnamed protein product [Euphydryas editha]
MDKSFSEPNINHSDESFDAISPAQHITQRYKRRRDSLGDIDDRTSFKEEIRDMITSLMKSHGEELKKITAVIMDIKETNSSIEKSVEFLSEQNAELHKKIENLQRESKKDKEYIALLEDRVEDLQRGYRKCNLEIKNVPKIDPKETKEDLINMVLCLSKTIGCDITKTDIKDIYRVRGKKDAKNGNTPIIIETSSTILKSKILKHSKSYNNKNKQKLCSKHLGLKKSEEVPIFVSEQLTSKAARIYFLARDLSKSRAYKFCWTSYGRVYVRKDEQSPVITIKSEAQVQKLLLDT